MTTPYPPGPQDTDREAAWTEGRLRRRLLEGCWSDDLERAVSAEIEADRADLIGTRDMSHNLARDVWTQSAALYREMSAVSHTEATPEALEAWRGLLEAWGWRACMDAAQPLINAQREGVIRVDVVVDGDARSLRFAHVPADLVEAWPHPRDPERVGKLRIYTPRRAVTASGAWIPGFGGAVVWTAETWDITGAVPAYTVEIVSDADGNAVRTGPVDVTVEMAPATAAGGYPWIHTRGVRKGSPYIPAVLYHARRGLGRLFDPWYGVELVRGSLSVSVFQTLWRQCFRDTSWPQRNVMDADPAGGVKPSAATPNVATVTTDRTSILVWRSRGDKAGSFFQFAPGGDPVALADAIASYAAGLVAAFGVSAADVTRVAADPRSGYAIALSREGIRKEIARYSPHFAVSDVEIMGVAAALWNAYGGGNFPEDGWTVAHRGLPLSPEEEKIEMERAKMRVELGIASTVDLYMTAYGVTRAEAIAALKRIALERALVASFAAPEPSPPPMAGSAPTPEPPDVEDDPPADSPPENDTPEE